MPFALPKIQIGEPIRHEALTVFPLFMEPHGDVDYRLADEAIADESLSVKEISERGSVPDLLVENKGDHRVLFIEGEELVGAKQNRVLNTSVLIAAKSKVKIPVSCVEQGRWSFRSRKFRSSGSHVPSKLRYAMKKSVGGSAKAGRGHRSNQGEVWGKVKEHLLACKTSSPTDAMGDGFRAMEDKMSDYNAKFKYVPEAIGMAVAIGKQVVCADLFDKPTTCEKVWDRLLSGCIVEALSTDPTDERVATEEVEKLLVAASEAPWKKVDSVGDGEEYRSEVANDQASVLSYEDTVLHGSVVAQC